MSKKLTTEEFVEKARKKHGDKYDYSLVDYVNSITNVKLICSEHGIFEITPNSHLRSSGGSGCIKCSIEEQKTNIDDLIVKFNKAHKNKFDYSLVKYKNAKTKIKVICPKHGIFEVNPTNHKNGLGCSKCTWEEKMLNTKEIKEKFIKIHKNKYDYSLVEYKGTDIKVKIICHKHGIFEQTPHSHLQGQGCPTCKESYGEKEIRHFLDDNKISYVNEKRFDDCKNKRRLPFDFYLPDHNICIEYDGKHHYEPIFGEEQLKDTQRNDKIKNKYCINNNIKMIRIKYDENILTTLKSLI